MRHFYKRFDFERLVYLEKGPESRGNVELKSPKTVNAYIKEGDDLINRLEPVKETSLSIDDVDQLRADIKAEFLNFLEGLAKKSYNPAYILDGLNGALKEGKLADLATQIEDYFNAPNTHKPVISILGGPVLSDLQVGSNKYFLSLERNDAGQFYVSVDSFYVGPQYTEKVDAAMEELRLSQDKMSPGEYQRKMNRMERVADRLLGRAERRSERIVEREKRKERRLALREYRQERKKLEKSNTPENELKTQKILNEIKSTLISKVNEWANQGVSQETIENNIKNEWFGSGTRQKLEEIFQLRSKLYVVEIKFAVKGYSYSLRLKGTGSAGMSSMANDPDSPYEYNSKLDEV